MRYYKGTIYYIYVITNKLNNKSYVGQSLTPKKRWTFHKNASLNCKLRDYKTILHNAIRKYGVENFLFQVIEELDNVDDCNEAEEFYIQLFQTKKPNGYNIRNGGDNHRLSEETKKKIGKANSGRPCKEETKKKLSKRFTGTNNPMFGVSLPSKKRIDNVKEKKIIELYLAGIKRKHIRENEGIGDSTIDAVIKRNNLPLRKCA